MGKRKRQETKPEKCITFHKHFSHNEKRYKGFIDSPYSRPVYKDVHIRARGFRSYSRNRANYASNKIWLKSKFDKKPSRPSSPVLGSEEYMDRKIQQTSAIIMKQLLNPDQQVAVDVKNQINDGSQEYYSENTSEKNKQNQKSDKPSEVVSNRNKKSMTSYDIEEIQKKIVNHITNLNDGKKKNLVYSNSSSYDIVIQQIQKQKRLEISRALRNMCSQSSQTQESSDFINSIIPDIGIKIEDLPRDVIEELTNTLNRDYESNYGEGSLNTLSQDTGYCSLSEPQPQEDGVLNSFVDNQLPFNININSGLTKELPLFTSDSIVGISENVSIGNQINNSKNVHNDDVKKDLELHCDDAKPKIASHETIHIKSEIIDETALFPSDSNICVNGDVIIRNETNNNKDIPSNIVKQEIDQYTDETNINKGVLSETSQKLIQQTDTEICEITINDIMDIKEEIDHYPEDTDIKVHNADENLSCTNEHRQLENNSLPVNRKSQGELNPQNKTFDNKATDCSSQECLHDVSSLLKHLDVAVQTEENDDSSELNSIERILQKSFQNPSESISDAINRMLKIDEWILKLTAYRQSLFVKFKENERIRREEISKETKYIVDKPKTTTNKEMNSSINPENNKTCTTADHRSKNTADKHFSNCEIVTDEIKQRNMLHLQDAHSENKEDNDYSHSEIITDKIKQQNMLNFQDAREKILVIKKIEDKLVAGSESGKIFFCSLEDGHYSNILQVSYLPITDLRHTKISQNYFQMYVGSLESSLKIYDFNCHRLYKTISISDSIQCLESNWGFVFMGCSRGSLLRYSIKKEKFEYEDKICDDRILCLKATFEGARKVLIIGCRNLPIYIRDAMTGLFMRTLEHSLLPSLCSLIMGKSLIYCGTVNNDILVFSFHDGQLINRYRPTKSKGVSCLKIIKNLLFAGCYNGNVYICDINENKIIDDLQGPGGVILSMEVLENQVIVGTISSKFTSIPIPQNILSYYYK